MEYEFYNWRANWIKVVPFLKDKKVQRALSSEILKYAKQYKKVDEWKSHRRPWEIDECSFQTHIDRAEKLAYATQEYKDWSEAHPLPEEEDNDNYDEEFQEYINEQDKIFSKYYPKKYELEWYQAYGLCHWLVKWQKEIVLNLFPNEIIIVCEVRTPEHSVPIVILDDKVIIFDILQFESVNTKKGYPYPKLLKEIKKLTKMEEAA